MLCCYSYRCGVRLSVEVIHVESNIPNQCTLIYLSIYSFRSRRAGKINLDQSKNMPTQLYEDPDKLTGKGQGNFELTQCLAYESTTPKPESPPWTQAEEDQSSHYEL